MGMNLNFFAEKISSALAFAIEIEPTRIIDFIVKIPWDRLPYSMRLRKLFKGVPGLTDFLVTGIRALASELDIPVSIKTVVANPDMTYFYIHIAAPANFALRILEKWGFVQKIFDNYTISLEPDVTQADYRLPEKGGISVQSHETMPFLGFDKIHADPKFERGKGIRAIIYDTGIGDGSVKEPQLYEKPKDTKSRYRVILFRDFTKVGYPTTNPYADHPHGNWVSCLLAGGEYYHSGNKKTYVGCLPMADLIGAKVLDKNGQGFIINILAAISWGVELRKDPKLAPHIANFSLGDTVNSDGTDEMCSAVDDLWRAGATVVVANGNNGQAKTGHCNATMGRPACAKEVIKATATSGAKPAKPGDPEMIQTWASRPPTLDGRKGPELHVIAAPGLYLETRRDKFSGTSGACPILAGIGAVAHKKSMILGLGWDNYKIRDVLEATALPLGYKEAYGREAGFCIEGHGRGQPLKIWQESTGPEPECKEGDIEFIETCPDGSWRKRKVCKNGKWQQEERECPSEPEKIPVVTVSIRANGEPVYLARSDATVTVEIESSPSWSKFTNSKVVRKKKEPGLE